MSLKLFIEAIREEKDGFSLSKPWRLEEKSMGVIVPILRKNGKDRDYITFPEASKIKAEDTGQIDYIYVKNDEEKPVLIARGEIFRGKTQERAVIHDTLIKPGTGIRVAVRCIHQSKGIQSGSEVKYGGRTPYDIDLSNQSKTWSTVSNFTHQYYSSSTTGGISDIDDSTIMVGAVIPPTVLNGEQLLNNVRGSDDLHYTLQELSDNVREIMKKIPPIDNQVGAAFFQDSKFQGMDVFDLPDSWSAIKEDVVAKEGASFLKRDEDEMFEFKAEKGLNKLKKELSHNYEEKVLFKAEDHKLIQVMSKNLIGEGIVLNDKVIHLTLWKRN